MIETEKFLNTETSVVAPLTKAIDSIIVHFNSQIDSLCDKLIMARKEELSKIDDNFKTIRDTLNKLVSEKNEAATTSTPRATHNKR